MAINLAAATAQMTADSAMFQASSPIAREIVLEKAKKGAEIARSIAPIGPHSHRLKSGYTDGPGDYRKSIEGSVVFEDGKFKGRVTARDYKARWIEFGTKRMPKQSVMRRSRAQLEGLGG